LMKIYALHINTDISKGMNVTVAYAAPIYEFNAKFECAMGRFEEVSFFNAKHRIKIEHVRYSGFTNANSSNLI